jgi:hypothetical protein
MFKVDNGGPIYLYFLMKLSKMRTVATLRSTRRGVACGEEDKETLFIRPPAHEKKKILSVRRTKSPLRCRKDGRAEDRADGNKKALLEFSGRAFPEQTSATILP